MPGEAAAATAALQHELESARHETEAARHETAQLKAAAECVVSQGSPPGALFQASGAGTEKVNGWYKHFGTYNDKPKFFKVGPDGSKLQEDGVFQLFYYSDDGWWYVEGDEDYIGSRDDKGAYDDEDFYPGYSIGSYGEGSGSGCGSIAKDAAYGSYGIKSSSDLPQ